MAEKAIEPPPEAVIQPDGVQYHTGALLGKGGFAHVYAAKVFEDGKPTAQRFALKVVKSKIGSSKLVQKVTKTGVVGRVRRRAGCDA